MTSDSVIGQDQKAQAVERSACKASAKQCCTLEGREPRGNIYYRCEASRSSVVHSSDSSELINSGACFPAAATLV